MPAALADLHHSTRVGGLVEIVLFGGDDDHVELTRDDFPGRRFSRWPDRLATDVLVGAGFSVESVAGTTSGDGLGQLRIRARRRRSIADTVGAGMVLLVCGLNPSLYAADRGVGYARPGNRFWPAALAAGLVTRDRDPVHALAAHGVGMTDLVKRATRRAAELSPTEYEAGLGRVGRLVEWLRPGALCVVGLAGWRAAVDPSAAAGVQPDTLGGRPVYLMPSTSGLNAHSGLEDLTDHLRAARAAASR
ncbi:MAG: mismatch-specific DNA-glycosylase [Acidimicrobiia bacterium]|nr:mismatch-specific DNA-glycosylase [Acidimicrobiia bacterium]